MTDMQKRCESVEEQNMISESGFAEIEKELEAQLTRIQQLNDQLRTTGRGGMVLMTNGIAGLVADTVNAIFAAVAAFTDFNPDNDPRGEHDCAVMTVNGIQVIWKIDYYDRSRTIHSPDPADPRVADKEAAVRRDRQSASKNVIEA